MFVFEKINTIHVRVLFVSIQKKIVFMSTQIVTPISIDSMVVDPIHQINKRFCTFFAVQFTIWQTEIAINGALRLQGTRILGKRSTRL